jgi:hypothetical protein
MTKTKAYGSGEAEPFKERFVAAVFSAACKAAPFQRNAVATTFQQPVKPGLAVDLSSAGPEGLLHPQCLKRNADCGAACEVLHSE